ncbi:hypothetical protein CIB48_g5066 [Xylaria polymorpha]|nr:hypothetical protein CIB48_g5066 [Xylaria polymorpha]
MASTAVRFPVDKDQNQLPFWPDNDELAVTADNFFDQFVTFDAGDAAALGGDVLEDPPSPSILLESLHNEAANSPSRLLDLPPDNSHIERPATTTSQPIVDASQTSSAEQILPDSALFAILVGEPVLNNGSISDSELLHLEGISLQSSPPRGNATAPSSPMLAASAPLSPRKHCRFVESVYATVRRAVHRPKPVRQEHFQPVDMTDLDAFLSDPRSGLDIFDNVNFDELTDPTIAIKHEPINCNSLPLSPPLTGRIPNDPQVSPSGFVTGHLEDPFCDEALGSPAVIHPAKRQDVNTPMGTPLINGDTFFQNHQVITPSHANMSSFRHPHKTYRSTSSAEWPIEGLLTDVKYTEDANIWSSASPSTIYVADNNNTNITSPNWWETPEISHAEPAHHHHNHHHHDNAAHNISMHNQQSELAYEYNNADLLSGLMIHMPQPRTPQASVLSANLNEQQQHLIATSSYAQGTPTLQQQRRHHFPPPPQQGHKHTTDRRPRPRAPSSGARHHGSQTSPRKLHHSTSLVYLREESASPSPLSSSHNHGSSNRHHQERRQHRSSSLAVRKQRSFTRRGGSGSHHESTFATTPNSGGGGGSGSGSGGGGGGGGGGGFNLEFLNYTPNDKKVLMTGVAPSGSSKTKARREKEALEKAARLSEAALKVAGGDGNPVLLKELMRDFSLPDA